MTLVFDGHNDAVGWLVRHPRVGTDRFLRGGSDVHVDLPRARAGGLGGGMFAILAEDDVGPPWVQERLANGGWAWPRLPIAPERARAQVLMKLGALLRLQRDSGGAVPIVGNTAELRAAMRADQLAMVIHLEGAAGIEPDLALLDVLQAAGLRSLGLVWSRPNRFAHGVPLRYPGDPDDGPGLTAAGKRLVRACNERRILIDLAHLNARGIRDVAALSSAPLVASHTAAHALTPSARNLTDAQLDVIGASGGLVGVFFSIDHVCHAGAQDAETAILDHVEHVADRIGVDHVAFGSDFDGTGIPPSMDGAASYPRTSSNCAARGLQAGAAASARSPATSRHRSDLGRSLGHELGLAVDLEPDVRRPALDAPPLGERLDEMQAPAAAVAGRAERETGTKPAPASSTSTRMRRGVCASTRSLTEPRPPNLTLLVISSVIRSLMSDVMSAATRLRAPRSRGGRRRGHGHHDGCRR